MNLQNDNKHINIDLKQYGMVIVLIAIFFSFLYINWRQERFAYKYK